MAKVTLTLLQNIPILTTDKGTAFMSKLVAEIVQILEFKLNAHLLNIHKQLAKSNVHMPALKPTSKWPQGTTRVSAINSCH